MSGHPSWVPHPFHRRSPRVRGYDYAQPGAYFITIGTQNHRSLFGAIVDDLVLSDAGRAVERVWLSLASRFPNVALDSYVFMPDHMHGIIVLQERQSARHSLGEIVGAFKGISTLEYARGVHESGWLSFEGRLWERNYFEKVIRGERALREVRRYIANNVRAWILEHGAPIKGART